MLKEKGQNRVTVVVSKIDAVVFTPDAEAQMTKIVTDLFTEFGWVSRPNIYFTSTKTDHGIEELKKALGMFYPSLTPHVSSSRQS